MYSRTASVSKNDLDPHRGAKQGGLGGSQPPPPEFGMGGLNTCQPPQILRKIFLGGLAPLKLI